MEFCTSPQTAIEALIHINNQLRQPEAAVGVLTYAQKHLAMDLKESWYEKLCRWVWAWTELLSEAVQAGVDL
jgi:FKBP12-rapamycin complex-associated protein